MNPGTSEPVAPRRYRQIVARGLREQVVASAVLPRAGALAVRTVLKRQLGKVLVRVRVRLQNVHTDSAQSLTPDALGTEGVSASSDEPIYWLSPCRLP